jgi:hypothetical protein
MQAQSAEPLSPAQEAMLSAMRRRMMVSITVTLLGIAAVLGVIAYKLLRGGGSPPAGSDVTAVLPKGARIVSTAMAGDRVIVTVEVNGATELRAFDARTLQPAGRLKFAVEP